jgi:hypothetical protein
MLSHQLVICVDVMLVDYVGGCRRGILVVVVAGLVFRSLVGGRGVEVTRGGGGVTALLKQACVLLCVGCGVSTVWFIMWLACVPRTVEGLLVWCMLLYS